jgi:hypothetical protein
MNKTLISVFETEQSAFEGLTALEDFHRDGDIRLYASPVITTSAQGWVSVPVAVIAGQPGLDAGPIKDATVAGHAGKYVDLVVTADPATCGNGQDGFWIWGNCPAPVTVGCEDVTGDRFFGVSKGDADRAYALDFGGKAYTFFTNEPAGLLAADRAELHRVFDSIRVEPAG